MCGIACFFARESVPNSQVFMKLFDYASLRGSDGFGFSVVKRSSKMGVTTKDIRNWNALDYDEKEKIIQEYIIKVMDIGDILLANFRASPETENLSSENNLQPIINTEEHIILVHNGSISQQHYDDLLKYAIKNNIQKTTDIDSEALIWSYIKNNKDLKQTLESISGGWSLIMFDGIKDRLLAACSWNPMAHGYIKGVGYFIHSTEDVFPEIMKELGRRVQKCGAVLWEDFYWHERDGFRYFEVDCDSGVETAGKYSHYFLHPSWNSKNKGDGTKYLVCASGGLDSTTTAVVLKEFEKDIHLVHFKYGHRGQNAEEIAVKKVAEYLDCPLTILDLQNIYQKIDDFSMLTNPDVRVITGMKPKTTNAWTCGRNMVFGALLGAFAESLIMKEDLEKVRIAGGWSNLSESASYPDNSEKFIYALEQIWKYGTLPGGQGRISFVNVCRNVLKTEQICLLEHFGHIEILGYTVSCDRPIVEDGIVKQCSYIDDVYGQMPACGSGLLSWWAMKKLGIEDPRKYYIIDDKSYKAHIPKYIEQDKLIENIQIDSIIKRLLF